MFVAAYRARPRLLGRTVGAVRRWPVGSQQAARRNAMVAATTLAQRRAEREEVDEFLAGSRPEPGRERAADARAHG